MKLYLITESNKIMKKQFTAKEVPNRQDVKTATISIILASILTIGILIYIFAWPNNSETVMENVPENKPTVIEEKVVPPEPENTSFTYPNTPVTTDGHFFEELIIIGGQQSYISHPVVIDTEAPPSIIIYSHGSNTTITGDMSEGFMQDMRLYGGFFTQENFIFAASNQHGANWGNADSVQDMANLIEYIKETYQTTDDIYLIGFSMGGLPTWKYMFKYPETVVKAALLAPTTYSATYTTDQVLALKDIDIHIWHGDADVNVPISLSLRMVTKASPLGIEIGHTTVKGATHWDLDTEFMDEILKFYNQER